MSADVGGIGWQAGSLDTILKGDHPRTIPSKFGPKSTKQFQRRRFLKMPLYRVRMLKLCWLAMAAMPWLAARDGQI